jgi:hypothetical protein
MLKQLYLYYSLINTNKHNYYKMKQYLKIVLLFIAVVSVISCKQNKMDITGKWKSESIETLVTGNYGKRLFTIDAKNWEVQFTMYLDSAATKPVFTFKGSGPYTLGEKSATVADAMDGTFSFTHKYLTLHTADTTLVKNLGFTQCGLQKDVEADITEKGCSFLESVTACAQEYDLVALKDGKMYGGQRPPAGTTLCDEKNRPTALGKPLVKVN